MFCHKCGTQYLEDAGFCDRCGTKVVIDNETAPFAAVDNPPPQQPHYQQTNQTEYQQQPQQQTYQYQPSPQQPQQQQYAQQTWQQYEPPPKAGGTPFVPVPKTPVPAQTSTTPQQPIKMPVFCHKCGTQSLEDGVFCEKCGSKLIIDDVEKQTAAATFSAAANPPPQQPFQYQDPPQQPYPVQQQYAQQTWQQHAPPPTTNVNEQPPTYRYQGVKTPLYQGETVLVREVATSHNRRPRSSGYIILTNQRLIFEKNLNTQATLIVILILLSGIFFLLFLPGLLGGEKFMCFPLTDVAGIQRGAGSGNTFEFSTYKGNCCKYSSSTKARDYIVDYVNWTICQRVVHQW